MQEGWQTVFNKKKESEIEREREREKERKVAQLTSG
jgi:hypothetical protein